MSPSASTTLEQVSAPLSKAIARVRPAYFRLFEAGDQPIGAYLEGFSRITIPPIQSRSDYIDEVAAHTHASHGAVLAEKVRARLERSPVVFTANHLCLECMPLTVQSLLLAGISEDPAGVIPVEASALIPADNASYPVGLLLARPSGGKTHRIPLLDLSKRQRRQMTLALPPFQGADLDRAAIEVEKLAMDKAIGIRERTALQYVLQDLLRTPEVLEHPTFREQAVAATPRLWNAWFDVCARPAMPALAYAPIESIRVPLLIQDLGNPHTPMHQLFFNEPLRERILRELDGVPCCWKSAGRSGGSALLWEVTPALRTSPLVADGNHLVTTEGRRIPLVRGALEDGLATGSLIPTSFLSLALGLVRGLVQIGGFQQVDYLASMQRGLAQAFASVGETTWASAMRTPVPPMLTAGLAGVLVHYENGEWASAGGIEFMAHGGLGLADLERVKGLSLREALALELPGIARMVLGEQGLRQLDLRLPDPTEWMRFAAGKLPSVAC